jgi:hypothetical protein
VALTINKPEVPGTVIGFTGSLTPQIPAQPGSTVAVPLAEHDWGPMAAQLTKPEVLQDFQAWIDKYGDTDTPGRTAVALAFAGQNIVGGAGAGGVIPMRMGTGAAQSTLTINNTAGTPVAALTLKGRWKGTRGDLYSVVIDSDPAAPSTRDRLRVRFRGVVIDTFIYDKTDITALAASITARPDFPLVVSGAVVSGTSLAPTAGTNLAGGSNGNTITSQDYLDVLAALEYQPFALLAPYNLTDGPTQAAIWAWTEAQVNANRPVMYGVGGAAGETLDTAIARSVAMPSPHVFNFGVGTFHHDLLDKDLSTAQLVPLIAGVIAARGEKSALTGALLGGLHVVGQTGVSASAAATAIRSGVTVAIRTDDDEADLRIAQGLTTYVSEADPLRPRKIFSEPRFVLIMDNFVRYMRKWGDKHIVGAKPVNDDSRDATRQEAYKYIDRLRRDGLIIGLAGGAQIDPFVRTPVTTDDTLPFEFGWQFAYTANYVIGSGSVR